MNTIEKIIDEIKESFDLSEKEVIKSVKSLLPLDRIAVVLYKESKPYFERKLKKFFLSKVYDFFICISFLIIENKEHVIIKEPEDIFYYYNDSLREEILFGDKYRAMQFEIIFTTYLDSMQKSISNYNCFNGNFAIELIKQTAILGIYVAASYAPSQKPIVDDSYLYNFIF